MVEEQPLITTIIPTYRRPGLLKKAIESALNQTFSNIQVCVYDNASNDETADIVSKLMSRDLRVKYYCHPEPIDAVDNFLFGLSKITTPFFSFLADDDLLLPQFYEITLKTLDRYPRAQFCLGSTVDVDEKGKLISANAYFWKQEYYEPPFGVYPAVHHYFNWTGALFRKSVLDHATLDKSVKPIDFDFIAKLAATLPFAIVKKPCALFFHHPKSYSVSFGLKLIYPSWLKIAENLGECLKKDLVVQKNIRAIMHKQLKRRLRNLILLEFSRNQPTKARAALEIYSKEFPHSRSHRLLSILLQFPKLALLMSALLKLYSLRRIPLKMKYSKLLDRNPIP
jgi:glycosyltransferase involved in cell wall biosynthesis